MGKPNYYSLPPWHENPWIELYMAITPAWRHYKISNNLKQVIADQLTEEQITDIQEVQDSLIIPYRQQPATATCLNTCTCVKRHLMISPDEPGGLFRANEIAQFAGKVSTKIRR